ncbi:hypothetical protein DFR29_11839 [Tahibacter aquaticus]|uniref:VCBS repeat protein n=1 Tax=Tahibacter aquaticus TaxID=520092 RepID=A0A4R6YMW4_9GAMM|nr:hypothetical protein [Tahibacter aquaticus]TDR38896.1 hypothetical protein DFR29_11839 [Tahibacter aquaticus]
MKIARLLPLLALFSCPLLAAEPSGAEQLGKLLANRDKDACTSLTTEAELWRDATAADYGSSGWAAWRKYTQGDTPWRATGDFDGDGLQDVAKVIVDKAGKRWMMGVMFGHADGAPCHRYQISGRDLATLPIAGVLTLPKGKNSLTCHHMGEQGPVTCTVENAAFAARTTDALLTFDDVPSYSSAYLWQPGAEGRNRGKFEQADVALAADYAGMAAHSQADAQNSKAGDGVSAAERKALVQEFEQAWSRLQGTKNYRSIQTAQVSSGQAGDAVTRTITEYADATHTRTTLESGAASVVFLRSGAKVWTRADGTHWTALPDEGAPMPMVSPIGDATITAVRHETRDGRAVKVLQLSGQSETTLVLDVARKLPLQRIDSLKIGPATSVTRTDYDYDVKVEIVPPAVP